MTFVHHLNVDGTTREINLAVARLFEEIAQSLEVAGEKGHRSRAYRRAARAVAATPASLQELAAEGRLRELPGVGQAIAALITEYLESGAIRTHKKLVDEHPPGLAPLLQARGFGPAGVHALHTATGVTNLDELEAAARDGRLEQVLGPRRAEELVGQLPALRNPIRSLPLKTAWESAWLLLELLGQTDNHTVTVAGAARRMCEMITGGLDLVAFAEKAQATLELLTRLPNVVAVRERTETSESVRLYDGLEVRLHLAEPQAYGAAVVWHTGSPAHVEHLNRLAMQRGLRLTPHGLYRGETRLPTPTEEDVYAALGLPYLRPELREDEGEIQAALTGNLPRLIEQANLKGDLHCHTRETDGSNSLEEMALAARARGYDYMALTDHSRSLTITNGLSLERLEEARRQVAQLNHRLAPFVILLGTEMDILEDGSLDYPDETLASLDYVSASIHSRFKQAEPVMTARILRAISNPLVHTLNHPHGRLLGIRPSYGVDMPRVVTTAATVGCAMEVSADPARMDLDGGWARRVREAGGRCTISSDAHSTLDFDNIWLAIGSARRGWLTTDDVLNTRPLDEFRALLRQRSQRIPR
ncbi:MAG: DNA polymerase III [Chloroflexi bacterium]|nr:DNA polymerase III [Chloroflexota bacterium]